MSELEQQTEEIEALTSIYEGDDGFKQLNNTTFQYKVNVYNFNFKESQFSNFNSFLSTAKTAQKNLLLSR